MGPAGFSRVAFLFSAEDTMIWLLNMIHKTLDSVLGNCFLLVLSKDQSKKWEYNPVGMC